MLTRGRWFMVALLALVGIGIAFVASKAPLSSAGTGAPAPAAGRTAGAAARVGFEVVGRGFHQVTDIQFMPGSSKTVIVLLKGGKAHLVTLSNAQAVTARLSPLLFEVAAQSHSELGLLGLAFHPRYRNNGLFYVNYTPSAGERRTRISEWHLDSKRLGHETAKEVRTILEVPQPYANHNAGQLAFGPDGMLYVGLGDGGKRADPHGHGQDLSTLLGSMLRIDVDRRQAGLGYAIPRDNPFVLRQAARGEIWAYGLRNPWRYSFDEGRLIVADVGQDTFEEVDIVERGDNLGWARREASQCFPPGSACSASGFKEPVFEYGRDVGTSITGGYVYRGKAVPALVGKYVLADYESGRVFALRLPKLAKGRAEASELGRFRRLISTFGRDASGELYAGDFGSGDLLKLVQGGS